MKMSLLSHNEIETDVSFHQIIHFRYITCLEAFEFAQVLSSSKTQN
jgi:hypothetical protein